MQQYFLFYYTQTYFPGSQIVHFDKRPVEKVPGAHGVWSELVSLDGQANPAGQLVHSDAAPKL